MTAAVEQQMLPCGTCKPLFQKLGDGLISGVGFETKDGTRYSVALEPPVSSPQAAMSMLMRFHGSYHATEK